MTCAGQRSQGSRPRLGLRHLSWVGFPLRSEWDGFSKEGKLASSHDQSTLRVALPCPSPKQCLATRIAVGASKCREDSWADFVPVPWNSHPGWELRPPCWPEAVWALESTALGTKLALPLGSCLGYPGGVGRRGSCPSWNPVTAQLIVVKENIRGSCMHARKAAAQASYGEPFWWSSLCLAWLLNSLCPEGWPLLNLDPRQLLDRPHLGATRCLSDTGHFRSQRPQGHLPFAACCAMGTPPGTP